MVGRVGVVGASAGYWEVFVVMSAAADATRA